MKAYRIKDWKEHFEKADSRKCKNMQWVAVPNRFDGVGYSLVMAHERSSEIFTAWVLMLELASKQKIRGELVNGKPLTPRSMAIMTRTKPEIFEVALKVLVDPEIGWIEEFDPSSGRHPDSIRTT